MLEKKSPFTKPQKMLRMSETLRSFRFYFFFGCSCRAYLSVKLYRGIYMDMLGMLSAEEETWAPRFVISAFSAELLWVDEIFELVETSKFTLLSPLTWMLMIYCEFGNKFCIAVSEHPVNWLSKNAKRGATSFSKDSGQYQTGSPC